MPEVRHSWERIVAWYRANVLGYRDDVLGPVWQREGDPSGWTPSGGARAADIVQAEQAIALSFPDDLRASYLLYDGSADAVFPWGYHLLSLPEMIREWRKLRELFEKENRSAEPKGPIRPVHWSIRWIPVASNESGDYHFVDLDPAPGGTLGQVIHFNHELGPVRVLARGVGAWLAEYADQLEAGVYYYDPYEAWVRRDDMVQ